MTWEQLWNALPVPSLRLDADDRILESNPAAELFLNQSARALKGAPVWDIVTMDAPIEEAFARTRDHGATLYVNDVDVGGGGRPPMRCNVQIAALPETEGHMLLLIQPWDLARHMRRGNTAQAAARSAIGMSEMLAHEIKNPLAGIIGAAQLLSMSLPAKDREMTDLIVGETRRIMALLERVEQFGTPGLWAPQPVNLHDVLDRARRSAMVGFGAHMRFVERYDPSLPEAWGDPDQLMQVVLNLLKNASEAAQASGGTITLRTYYEQALRRRGEGHAGVALPLQVEIEDDGPGLPPEMVSHAFDPFVSGKENGTGLGLALVSKIISDHDGWVSVDTVPGRTVFRLSLPMVPKKKEG